MYILVIEGKITVEENFNETFILMSSQNSKTRLRNLSFRKFFHLLFGPSGKEMSQKTELLT